MNMEISASPEQKAEFSKMLAWIELCGSIGHSCEFKVRVDGDGKARMKFGFSNKADLDAHKALKKALLEEYSNNGNLKEISFE